MATIERKIRCSLPLCESCRTKEFQRKVTDRLSEAGIDTMEENRESKVDDGVWDEIDAALGIRTREVVQEIILWGGEYHFSYPRLYVDLTTPARREAAKGSGAVVTSDGHDGWRIEWEIPQCGVFSGIYIMDIEEVPLEQLESETFKYAKDNGKPTPEGADLLRCMKNTVRHQHSNYNHFISWHQKRQPFTNDGVKAIRSAYNEEIGRLYPDLKARN